MFLYHIQIHICIIRCKFYEFISKIKLSIPPKYPPNSSLLLTNEQNKNKFNKRLYLRFEYNQILPRSHQIPCKSHHSFIHSFDQIIYHISKQNLLNKS